MDANYAINLAKTTCREAYEQRDVEKLLSVFAADGFTDMSEGLPSKYGQEARTVLRSRAQQLFADYMVKLNIIIIDVVIQGDTARDYGWHEWILTPKTAGPVVRKKSCGSANRTVLGESRSSSTTLMCASRLAPA